jgi:DNA-binding NarL/FixJ family response regulator
MSTIRILVVDDHAVFAEAIATRLGAEPDLAVVGTAGSATSAVAAVESLRPDVVLLDVELGRDDGIELASALRGISPSLVIVFVTCVNDATLASEAIRAGASAWVTKDGPVSDLLSAIRGAVQGESWIPGKILTAVLKELLASRRALDRDAERLARLTPRERAVLDCMADGLDRQSVARRLYLSTNTVRTHVQSILTKLQVHSSLEAVTLALRVRADEQPAWREVRA